MFLLEYNDRMEGSIIELQCKRETIISQPLTRCSFGLIFIYIPDQSPLQHLNDKWS